MKTPSPTLHNQPPHPRGSDLLAHPAPPGPRCAQNLHFPEKRPIPSKQIGVRSHRLTPIAMDVRDPLLRPYRKTLL